jgi:hypothetical protein
MHYEINVSYMGVHMFATHERSITDRNKLVLLMRKFLVIFPNDKGYELTVTRYETGGYILGDEIIEDANSEYLKDLSYV